MRTAFIAFESLDENAVSITTARLIVIIVFSRAKSSKHLILSNLLVVSCLAAVQFR